MRHRVTFEVEDGCVFTGRTECLSEEGSQCRIGCPVKGCEWEHPREGCRHCEGYCVVDGCAVGTDRCSIAVEHGEDCPHAFRDTGECWLVPWADESPEFLSEDPQILARVKGGRDEHSSEMWTVVFTSYEGEYEAWWAPADPDMATLRRVS